ncbi:rRNA pseudouridine synthase [Candidatus Saganbacteria bacterium]|nr:rRNA pseudouridine synthase [Candidatus Saganbacteria bacterium]
MERLQKFLANSGIASRRSCEELIVKGKVKVNGKVVTELGTKIDPEKDAVEYHGKRIEKPNKKLYIKLNKPAGYITSCRSFEGATIFDLLKGIKKRVYPIGRLDKDSSGLLLLTNDGDLALELSHPRYEHEKEYEVEAEFTLSDGQIQTMRNGINLVEGRTLPADIKKTGRNTFKIIIREGKNRQIRRMLRAVNNVVSKLKRVRIDKITLEKLKEGEWKRLDKEELTSLGLNLLL